MYYTDKKCVFLCKKIYILTSGFHHYGYFYGAQYKNHTHVEKWDTPQNFFLAFIDEHEKQLFIKNLLKWVNKKCKNFNIYNVVNFLKK